MPAGDRSPTIMLRSPALACALSLALFIACRPEAAFAQAADRGGICTGRAQASLDDRIRACSSLIAAQKGKGSERLAVLHTSRGASWRAKGDLARALADHDEAIRLQPDSALLYFNRAIAWQSKDDVDRAIADFGEAIQRAPDFVLAYRNRGDLLYGKGDYTGAIREYDAVIRLAARDHRALAMRGLAKWQLGDGDSGKADIAAAMRIDVATAVALVSLARPAGAAAAATPSVDAPMIWGFKGSLIALRADGTDRRFYYETPRPELMASGIAAGTLLFEGRKEGNQYTGKMFVFSRKCGPRKFDVSGPLDDNSSKVTITLSGKRPLIDSNCRPTGSFQNDVLVFTYPAR
jgi:Tfp pilus assembly protein PilF